MYDYIVTAFNVLAGLITKEILMAISFVGIGIFLVWITLQLAFCFQRRFNSKCIKMYNFIKNNENNAECAEFIQSKSKKVSVGLSRGWKKFTTSSHGKPSDFITREEVLDKEINSGFLNNGRSIMKSYIWVVTVVLFIFNLSLVSTQAIDVVKALSFALVLPAITYFILKIFYYAYNNIRQQIYKSNVEILYEFLQLLDERFAKQDNQNINIINNVRAEQTESENETTEFDSELAEEMEDDESLDNETLNENVEAEPLEDYEANEEATFDDGDEANAPLTQTDDTTKNLMEDEESLQSDDANQEDDEVLVASSDQVTEDDVIPEETHDELEAINTSSQNEQADTNEEEPNESDDEVLEDVMDEEDEFAEDMVDEDEVEEDVEPVVSDEPAVSETTEPQTEEVDQSIADQYDIFKKKNIDVEKIINETPKSAEKYSRQYINVDSDYILNDDYIDEEESTANDKEPVETTKSVNEASTGEVEAQVKEDEVQTDEAESVEKDEVSADEELGEKLSEFSKSNEVAQEEKLSSIEDDYEASGTVYASGGKRVHKSKLADGGVEIVKNDYRRKPHSNKSGSGVPNVDIHELKTDDEDTVPGKLENIAPKTENNPQKNDSDLSEESAEMPKNQQSEAASETNKKGDGETKKSSNTKPKSQRRKRIKTNKKGDDEVEESQTKKSRGRPKNEIDANSLEITNDRQFNDVLARAEKLMRKSEEGLSQSQSKRIENELKLLIEAMNKYKEKRS